MNAKAMTTGEQYRLQKKICLGQPVAGRIVWALAMLIPLTGLRADEFSNGKALEPVEAVQSFEVPEGFEMQLVAHEPDVQEPIVGAYDENGWLYVAEYLKFPSHNGHSDGPDGRIRILRDRDGDGRYEQSQVFADELSWPTGICPWAGGVWVIAVPDLWYLKDTDGDGQADVRKKVYTGFAFGNEEGTANNLIWGLDGWIYGAGSNSGGNIQAIDRPKARAVSIRGCDFRFHPSSGEFQAISGAEQFGNTFDDWNNRFICHNSRPVVHVVLPARYLARNPYLLVPSVLHRAWENDHVYRSSEIEAWRLARTNQRLSEKPTWSEPSIAHDVFTACSGVSIYRGTAYAQQYRGNLFVGEVQSNVIHRRILQPEGVTFKALRVEKDTEFVRSKDNWFRPVNFINSPDGTLHIIDMYRAVIEAPDSLPEEILAGIDLDNGHNYGRIYRLAPKGFKAPPTPALGAAPTTELVRQLANPNGWWRDTAGRLLTERQDKSATEPLRAMLLEAESAFAQLHVLYALNGLGALAAVDVEHALSAPTPGVREHAIRLAEPFIAAAQTVNKAKNSPADSEKPLDVPSDSLLSKVIALAGDDNPRVRFQVAFSLGQSTDRRAASALAALAMRDPDDVWMQTAVLSSSINLAPDLIAVLLADADFSASSGGLQLLHGLALVVGGRNQPDEVSALLRLVESESVAGQSKVQRTIVLGVGDGLRRSGSSLSRYTSRWPAAAKMLAAMIAQSEQTLASEAASTAAQVKAVDVLAHGQFDDVRETLGKMLDSRRPPSVQLASVHALARFEHSDVPKLMIDGWQGLSPAVRGEVVEMLLGRVAWMRVLLDAVRDQRIGSGYISPIHKTRLLEHSDAQIRKHATDVFGGDALSPRKAVVDDYRSALALHGDAQRGKSVFEQHCMGCHMMGRRGHEVGPNLDTIRNRTPEALMVQILDPNREVLASYTQYIVLTDDGRVVSGLIASESPTSLTLKRQENVQQTILRQNIEEIIGTSKSLMPEGLEKAINQQQMKDLLSYLLTMPN